MEYCNLLEKIDLNAYSIIKYLEKKHANKWIFLGNFSLFSYNNNNNIKKIIKEIILVIIIKIILIIKIFIFVLFSKNKNKISEKFFQKCGYNNSESLSLP